MKKIKEIFETGGGDIRILNSLNNSSLISLVFLIIYAIIVFITYFFFNLTKDQEYLLSGLGIVLALFAISIRVFGLRGWKKIIRGNKK